MFKCEKMLNHTSCTDMIIDVNYLLSAKVLLKIVEVHYMWKKFSLEMLCYKGH